jgi:hypothetical protein
MNKVKINSSWAISNEGMEIQLIFKDLDDEDRESS